MSEHKRSEPGHGTGFAMKRDPSDKRPNLEMRISLDRDYRRGDDLVIVGWKKDKLSASGNVMFSLKVSQPIKQASPAAASTSGDDDIPF